jgi:hypothetical protein
MLTVELYKRDRRTRNGERQVRKSDHSTADPAAIRTVYDREYPYARGYRYEIYETYVTSRNALTGEEFQERYDTPYYASPRSETFWSS